MREIEENRAAEAIRSFLDSPSGRQRMVTAEWLAGRLGLALPVCEAALGRLVAGTPFVGCADQRPPRSTYAERACLQFPWSPDRGVARPGRSHGGDLYWVNSRYILLGAEALAIGLIVAFAWLDAELRDTKPPRPPP